MAAPRTPFEDLVHCVNNLLAVITTQSEVARAVGTDAATRTALATIEQAAGKALAEVRRLRAAGQSGAR